MKYIYCLLAGACDATTGLLLLFAPSFALRLMHIDASSVGAPVYLQWIGAFVFAVGSSYFWPFLRKEDSRFRVMLEMTTWIRVIICSFVLISVARGQLIPAWLSVAGTDGALAAIQIVMLKRKVF